MGGCLSTDSGGDEVHRHAGDGKDGSGDTALMRSLLHIVCSVRFSSRTTIAFAFVAVFKRWLRASGAL